MKKFLIIALLMPLLSQAQFNKILNEAKQKVNTAKGMSYSVDIGAGIKEALNKGIEQQVFKLTSVDGFYKNPLVKIAMPEQFQKVDKTLRKMGFSSLADDGIRSLNRAAEDAVKEATPIFVNAVKSMTITDAKNILMGNDNAATMYLQQVTSADLYAKFNPVVQQSIGKVGADKIWAAMVAKYNTIPLVTKANPDINDYVTTKALEGVYKMIAVEEKAIRSNISFRSTDQLKKVFALQDKK